MDVVLAAISAFVLYWVIRTGVGDGLKDFERWKLRQAAKQARADGHTGPL